MLRGLLCVGKVCYPELEHCTSAGPAVARASLRAEARRVGASTVAAPLRSVRVHLEMSFPVFVRSGYKSSSNSSMTT